ncbi:TetR/AcrR family transcriptional regulator [Nonomuraea aridisoli]|uniref:TetR family transcriptional regulator n=1 Tax=Nonomuraea aridisoli TaxID=2070368 RepID=A0A2W2FEJ2_9ACTN|nr:TetR/AcrR family transcriptional regulator [Nonomuraea aridisoli]PZG20067.1 TetR family transcriptional regulator [Nonomuraea aridisoli]
MGNREDLLEGAKRCLYERGYARTTARDIVAASGANLASIGYHYGSKEALLDAALIEAIGELSERWLQWSAADKADLAEVWDRILGEFDAHRPLLIAHVEAWAQVERSPELKERFAKFYADQLARGVESSRAKRPRLDAGTARALSAVTGALADGLIVQWLINPDQLPSGQEIAAGLRALADAIDEE